MKKRKLYGKMTFMRAVAFGLTIFQILGTPVTALAAEPLKPESEFVMTTNPEKPAAETEGEEIFSGEFGVENEVTEEAGSGEKTPNETEEEKEPDSEEKLPEEEEAKPEEEFPEEEATKPEEELPDEEEEKGEPEEKLPEKVPEESGSAEELPTDTNQEDYMGSPAEQQPDNETEQFEVEYESEKMYTGWNYSDRVWYYYNMKGEMQTGWQKVNSKWYYMSSSGAMQTGWQKVRGKWYYMNSSGAMQTGWQKIDGKWYYMNSNGAMQTGWQKLKNKWYYMNGSGAMQTGWQKVKNKWYYMNGNGAMQTGWQKIKGKWYYMNSSGAMQTGWQKVKNKWYYMNGSGEMQTDWQKIKGKWYYMNSSGAMQTGWQKIKGKWYYMNGSGAMQTGWQKLKGKWYYMNGSGAMQTGWQKIGNTWYYFDSNGVMQDSGDGPLIFKDGTVFQLNRCEASFDGESGMRITLDAQRNNSLEKTGSTFYIVMLNSNGTELLELSEGKVTKGAGFQIQASFDSADSFKTIMMSKYAIAVKKGYFYQVISEVQFLNNPEITVSQDEDFKDRYWGYYEGYKVTSKKGIQGVSDTYTEDLRAQHLLLNVDMQDLVWVRPASGYVPYEYKGKTYYFSDLIALKKTVYDLHGWGGAENAYGANHTRNVTLVLLLSWKYDALSYLIHPDARDKGAAPYYALNMKEEKARETFEALFCYLGEELGQMKVRVNNWTLGNEVNSCEAWNYSGSMPLSECVENYALGFQLLNQGIKRTASSPRLFISLDHCWNTAEAGHEGKAYLDEFAAYMERTAPDMQWNVNYHPYSQPLSRTDFWNEDSDAADSADTAYITMKNIKVLTDYLSKLESRYGKRSNSIRVILGEIGYSAAGGNKAEEKLQAAALGYGYYIALFNKRIDAYIIRAYIDAPKETGAGLYLGLRRNNSSQMEKESYALYKYLDTGESLKRMNRYLSLVGISDWKHVISGFDENAVGAADF